MVQLETARLILRPPAKEDFDAWSHWAADEEAMKHLGGVLPPAAVWRSIRIMAGNWALDGYSMFSVIEKATGRWIGRLGPWQPHDWPGTEVGWGLVREAWGKGYATEGATATIDWAFDHLGWTEVIHTIVPENVNSQKVAQRLGSTILRDGWLPAPLNMATVVWGQTREQWKARRR
ncbi:MAG: GNAT family N-acetyltransferase [Ferrovibrio sp.]|uniref:GNAT family N-acetyltransferase n=1 Tax=Ferrovibrio sp. TaxID=1917215 RepID=UPI00261F3C49|nr:GNAT family N-acetyltransferase [Ferrovibrio sp.]MCW0233544.1 GNAT family N-acetyltransferase [Ferrovibrio sp.]